MVQVIPDYTLLVMMAIFIIFMFILNALLYKPILSIIDRRKKQLEELDNEVRLFQESVEKRVAEYDEKLHLAKSKAADLKKEVIAEGSKEAQKVLDAVRNEIPAMAQEFQDKMEKEVAAARQVLQSQSRTLSVDIATKVLGRSVQ
ncbi:MAG TPA: ATP synthase F0 subunit B [Smithellaceae bacterium]|nr:ATP synthase F0 subunit B [Smithellaceae bacterium]